MASSGIDPLVRLQTGSKELRAERELCRVAAKQGFSTETGAAAAATSTRLSSCLFSASSIVLLSQLMRQILGTSNLIDRSSIDEGVTDRNRIAHRFS